MWWLVVRTVRSAPRRALLAAVAVAFPVAALSATLLFIDDSVHAMTTHALEPVQVEMRGLATSLTVDMAQVRQKLGVVPGVREVDLFGAADVVIGAPGAPGRITARLFAVDPAYLEHHPWVRASGDLRGGALLNGAVADVPGFAQATTISIELRGDTAPLGLSLPVAGRVDVREATTWFAIPAGDVQGDLAIVPRAILVDYATFERDILPALQNAFGGASAATNPGLSELPPASLEAHVSIDHQAYPSDPGVAAQWSATARRVLERQAPGDIVVADNTVERLTEAATDATDAKVIFFLLGIPGALVAAALGLAAASALAEAHRREDALLRLRGATDRQLVWLAVGQGLVAGVVGTIVGLAVAVAGVSLVIGHAAWRDIPADRLVFITVLAVAAGTITTAARLVPVMRADRSSSIAVERRAFKGGWRPTWLRARLDLVALIAGVAILGGNILSGGLQLTLTDPGRPSQALALAFYVLLAPVAIWLGAILVVVRLLLAALGRWSRPERPRPLTSWASTNLRWLGRRPARVAVALVLGALAVAFGAEVITFAATYHSAASADNLVAFGSDLRLTPATDRVEPLPSLGADVTSTTPIRFIPARAGSDRKTILAIDASSYSSTATAKPVIVSGGGVDALAQDPSGVLVAEEIAADFDVAVGDTLPVTVFPDDLDLSQKLDLTVVGVFRVFPPSDPISEMVVSSALLPPPVPPPDYYLARVADGVDPDVAAAELSQGTAGGRFTVAAIADVARKQQRSLTALNLDGLSIIEAIAAGLIAAVGVGVLGAFLTLERRREFAIMHSVGGERRQILTGPALEGAVATLGSLLIGIPIGVALGALAVRILGLFFTLPPPLVSVSAGGLAVLAVFVLATSGIALAIAMRGITRMEVASVLREP